MAEVSYLILAHMAFTLTYPTISDFHLLSMNGNHSFIKTLDPQPCYCPTYMLVHAHTISASEVSA
jgi:hypothetical protein